MPSNEEQRPSSPEVMAARHDVEEKRQELKDQLENVRRSSGKAVANFARKARPVLIGVAVVATVLLIVKVARSKRRRLVRYVPMASPEPPSLPRVAVGEALRAAVRMIAVRLAENAVLRLASSHEHEEPIESLSEEPISTAVAK
jgi:hypothetical protein